MIVLHQPIALTGIYSALPDAISRRAANANNFRANLPGPDKSRWRR
jgi:hypothetical protein